MQASVELIINAPLEVVFDHIDDPDKIMRWMDGVEAIDLDDGHDPAHPIGSRYRMTMREGGRISVYDAEILEYDKPSLLAVAMWNKSFTVNTYYRLSAIIDGTKLDYRAHFTFNSVFTRIIGKLFTWFTRSLARKQMANLKQMAEAAT